MLTAADVVGGSTEAGQATAAVDYNVTESEIEAVVTVSGTSADSVALKQGFAGDDGSEIYPLVSSGADGRWTLASMPLTPTSIDLLEAGALYLEISTAEFPAGALRGQILPSGVDVARVSLVPEQLADGGLDGAHAVAWLTIADVMQEFTVHLHTSGIEDATSVELRNGVGGIEGPVLATLLQDSLDAGHWELEAADFDPAMAAAADTAEIYLEVTSVTADGGAVRGQLLPEGYELVVTALTDEALVMGGGSSMLPIGRAMTTIGPDTLTSVVNLMPGSDASLVELRRAPEGQNGPTVAAFVGDTINVDRWLLIDYTIDPGLRLSLENRGVYVLVASAATPTGIARGQIEPLSSTEPAASGAFAVVTVSPDTAATVTAAPTSIVVSLNRAPLPASVTSEAVVFEASGQDGSFGDGNEVVIAPASVLASGSDVVVELATVALADDVYRLSLSGSGVGGIVDENGIALDGDLDGQPGGIYTTTFELTSPPVNATLSSLQDTIFSVSCATSGCHSGANPPDGLNLESGQSFSNLVNVASVQMPSLMRIEPGQPDDSYLVRKLQGTGIVASRMPLGQAPLAQAEIERVRQWVVEGAQDN